jgi:hypothetical protein
MIVEYDLNLRKASLFGVSAKRGGEVDSLPVIR